MNRDQPSSDVRWLATENGRLANELEVCKSALSEGQQRQAATSEILNVISRSASQLQPVLDTIVATAARLCQAEYAIVLKLEAGRFRLIAANNAEADYVRYIERNPPNVDRGSLSGRVVLERAAIHIPDVLNDPEYRRREAQKVGKYRTLLGVPLLRGGEPIGVVFLVRTEARPFTEKQIDLVMSFADQAIIAIENARLLAEVQEKSRQVEDQAAQLAEWNRTLETRVTEQVSQLGRMSKLTRFLSPKISELIMSGEADDPLKTRRSEVTVVYVDLRGFTAFTETADPEEVMGVLREYHAELGRAIMAFDGTIEHFAGDGAMILFNAPLPIENHELQAIRMTLQIRDAVAALASGWKKRGYALGFGAGIAGGYATIGTIGFEERLDYGAIGTVCNLAARLCGEADDGQILISPRVFAKMESYLEGTHVGELPLKGFHRPVAAYNVVGIRKEGRA
jgi:adenylate cyclase